MIGVGPPTVRKDRSKLDQAPGEGFGDGGGAVDGIQFLRRLDQMEFHGAFGNIEDDRNLPRRLAVGGPSQDFPFARRQQIALSCFGRASERIRLWA